MTTREDPSLDRPVRQPRRAPALMRLLVVLIPVLSLGLSGCELLLSPPPPIAVTVQNLCVGPNYTVSVYINNRYEGNVTTTRAFTGVRAGLVQLRAVGTGYGGSTYLHDRISYNNFTWPLCGGAGTLVIDEDAPDGGEVRKAE